MSGIGVHVVLGPAGAGVRVRGSASATRAAPHAIAAARCSDRCQATRYRPGENRAYGQHVFMYFSRIITTLYHAKIHIKVVI